MLWRGERGPARHLTCRYASSAAAGVRSAFVR